MESRLINSKVQTLKTPVSFRLVSSPFTKRFPVDGLFMLDGLLAEVTFDDGSVDYVLPYVDITFDQYSKKPGVYKYDVYLDEHKSYGFHDTFKVMVIE